ncbi:40S ribosomal protein S25, putative [Entamoeba invadens IP1]|uniref:40S ribosomal protein S25 n=1 Tax=Entamoeba invadens IP1 TaxID=370355 RepID=A0A0A1U6J8_ENTIV|nr:40S ribosomal protein S25, putative [Entamoeba invadens IP1]ELP90022.1 40S ribosomal protein S25, putative [Entamoeba invadens IP1]|eukprot:XP_004256793.1 40S ribosomal protein S25, putative [Entamoeba invadens IP1]
MPPKDKGAKGAAKGGKKDTMKPKSKSAGKVQKKSWAKSKVKEKLNNNVLFDQATLDKCNKEIPTMKVITPAVVSDRMKITCSLAKIVIKDLEKKGLIKAVRQDNHIWIFTKTAKATEASTAAADKKGAKGKVAAKKDAKKDAKKEEEKKEEPKKEAAKKE